MFMCIRSVLTLTQKDHLNHSRQENERANRSARPWVTFPVLDWFLYTPRLRRIIFDLKEKNDYRPDGLKYLYFQKSITFSVFVFMVCFVYALGASMYVVFFIALLFFLIFLDNGRHISNKYIIPYSIGSLVKGQIKHSEFHSVPIYVRGWIIRHEFVLTNIGAVQRKVLNVPRKEMGGVHPKKGDPVYIFYEAENPKNNIMYIKGYFNKCCVSESKYRDVTDFIEG